jgi:hypothetical protein
MALSSHMSAGQRRGHGHGRGHHEAFSGIGGPGYSGPDGTEGRAVRKTVLISLGGVVLLITLLGLGLEHEVIAVVVIWAVILGAPLEAIPVVVLLLLAPHLPCDRRSPGDR